MIRLRLTAPYRSAAGHSFGTSETLALPDAEAEKLLASGRAVLDPPPDLFPEEKAMAYAPAHKMIETRHTRTKRMKGAA